MPKIVLEVEIDSDYDGNSYCVNADEKLHLTEEQLFEYFDELAALLKIQILNKKSSKSERCLRLAK